MNIKSILEKTTYIDKRITLNDLLKKDKNNHYYLEYVCQKKLFFSRELADDILNNLEALKICIKYNYLNWIISINNEDIFLKKNKNGKNLMDYIFENNINYGFFFISYFNKRYEIIDYLLKYRKEDIYQLSYNIVDLIFTEKKGRFIVDKYVDNDDFIKEIMMKVSSNKLVNYCIKKNNLSLLKYADEEVLLMRYKGKYIIEYLLDLKIDSLFYNYYFKDKRIINILIARNRIDLLYKADLDLLFDNYNDKTYFDLMIEEHKKGIDVHFEKMNINFNKYTSYIIALKLMYMAHNDIIGYVPEITIPMLLYKSKFDKKMVIEWLIEMDKDITINKIIDICRKKYEPDFGIILRNLGIDDNLIIIKDESVKYYKLYIDKFNSNYIDDYNDELLIELKNLFYQDNISDKEIIDTLIKSYQYLLRVNYDKYIKEVKKLIEIKKNYPNNFVYKKSNNNSYFSSEKGIGIERIIISTINHETTHALHYYLSDEYVPDNYFEVRNRVVNDKNVLKRVKEYSIKFQEIKEQLLNTISKEDISNYYDLLYQGDNLLELAKFLMNSKDEKKEKYKNNYLKPVLDTILAKIYSTDEFIRQRKEIEKFDLIDSMFKCNYDAFIAIGDIIDEIFSGKFRNDVLYDESGNNINHTYGHGIKYYLYLNKNFLEMIANYGVIIKSKNSNEMILYLRSIIGNEMVDLLENVYEEKMLKSEIFNRSEDQKKKIK